MAICVIEKKTFDFEKTYNGRTACVKITERGSRYSVSIVVRLQSLSWFVDLLLLARCLLEGEKLVRTRDEGDNVLVFQWKRNARGWFVEVSVTPRMGKGRHIIIPKD